MSGPRKISFVEFCLDEFLMIVWWFLDDCLMVFWCFLVYFGLFVDDFLMIIWWFSLLIFLIIVYGPGPWHSPALGPVQPCLARHGPPCPDPEGSRRSIFAFFVWCEASSNTTRCLSKALAEHMCGPKKKSLDGSFKRDWLCLAIKGGSRICFWSILHD